MALDEFWNIARGSSWYPRYYSEVAKALEEAFKVFREPKMKPVELDLSEMGRN